MSQSFEVKTYLPKEILTRAKAEALARNMSLSNTLRQCLAEYFAIREELASSIQLQEATTENTPQKIIHILLARTEEKMERRMTQLENKLDVLTEVILTTNKK